MTIEEFSRRTFVAHAMAAAALPQTMNAASVSGNQDVGGMSPRVAVTSIRRAFHNGEHNAFTDLCWFQNKIYLTFRSCPDGHMVHPTSCVMILCSQDKGATWKEVHRFSVKHRDTRDPHFLVFKDRLFVYSGTWYSGATTLPRKDYDLNLHLGYAAWSDDGETWQGPRVMEGTFGHYIWRAASRGDTAYLCGRRKPQFEVLARGEDRNVESLLLESNDGVIWKKCGVFQSSLGDETAFLFEPDGTGLAIARDGDGKEAGLLRSQPPYNEWERISLDRAIGGPLLARWNNRYLVGGRNTINPSSPRTSLCWLNGSEISEFAELPSDGDNSYPGFVQLSEMEGLVSWYSSHETDPTGKTITAIYLANLRLI
ncbi:MAG: hypothetical protein ACK58L_11225 [Planctomycetota bacterium]